MADRALGITFLASLALMLSASVRVGAILMGLAFAGAALARQAGWAGELLSSRRQRTDVAVLSVFAVALITLAAVLPRR